MSPELLTIGEVANRTGVPQSALRFYEAQGLLTSTRSEGGQRRFSRDVIRRVSFIRVAQQVGLTLEQIGEALEALPGSRTPNRRDWTKLSRAWRPQLEAQIAILERLRDNLDSCIGCGCLSLSTCALYNPDDRAAVLGAGPRYLLGDSADDLSPADLFVVRGRLDADDI